MAGLQKLDKVINWDIFRKPIEEVLHVELKPPYDYLMMFKIIILQKYYNLSDEQIEFQIKDRLSFMQFLGLQIGDNVPDKKTIYLFKEELQEKKLAQKLFDLFTTQLIHNGVVVREGSMIDASFVDVPKQRNSSGEKKTREIPVELAVEDTKEVVDDVDNYISQYLKNQFED